MDVLADIAVIGAATAALGIIGRALIAIIRFISRMAKAAHVVLYELTPNNGASMKDVLNRIDRTVANHTERLDDLDAWRSAQEGDAA